MTRENIFRKIKRHISQFFETEYWYRFRKVPSYWFDDEKNKFVETKDWNHARDIITSTWNGENDILNMMRLKIEHMFHNLKKHAWQADFYVDSGYFFEEGATDKDRNLFVRQIIDECEKNPEKYRYSWHFSHKESYSNLACDKTSKKYSKKTPHRSFTNRWWIGNEETSNKNISASGLIHYYIFHDEYFDGWGRTTTWGIEKDYDAQIPPEQIPLKKKTYYLNIENPKESEEAPQYKTKCTEGVAYFPSCYGFKDIQKILDKQGIKIDALKGLLTGAQTMNVSDMQVYSKMSPFIQSVARGKRRVLKELLHLRHLVKKLNNLSDTDDKYYNLWKDAKLDSEEASKKVIEARKLFEEDRKKLYQEICDFIVANGETWWD